MICTLFIKEVHQNEQKEKQLSTPHCSIICVRLENGNLFLKFDKKKVYKKKVYN